MKYFNAFVYSTLFYIIFAVIAVFTLVVTVGRPTGANDAKN